MPADSEPLPQWIGVCAWCGVSLPAGDAPAGPAGGSRGTTHGICPRCRDAFIRALSAHRTSGQAEMPPVGEPF